MDGIHQAISNLMSSVTDLSVHYSDMPRSQAYKDKYAEYVARKEELEMQLLEIESAYMERFVRIEAAIAEIPYNQQRVIRLHYEQRKSWRTIARETHYSKSYCKRLHTIALKRLGAEQFPEENCKQSVDNC